MGADRTRRLTVDSTNMTGGVSDLVDELISVLKIDLQGNERAALRDAERALSQTRGNIIEVASSRTTTQTGPSEASIGRLSVTGSFYGIPSVTVGRRGIMRWVYVMCDAQCLGPS